MPPRRALLLVLVVVAAGVGAVVAAATSGGNAPEHPEAPPLAREAGRQESFRLDRLHTGLVRPTWVGVAPGDGGALWVLEQPGRVVRLAGSERRVVLDQRRDVRLGAEQGLLGAAFHPDFARNRRLALHHSDRRGDTRVIEVRVGRDRRADWAGRRELLFEDQPEENHNGGGLAFGPDGRLYLGLGDGGGAFDPRETSQDLGSRLGKLLAADVDAPGRPRWQAVAYGLRNPWRFSFDPALGEVWIGDVGQDEVEEVHRVYLELDEPPKNLGWSAYDGVRPNPDHRLDETGELLWPLVTYSHRDGCSVVGGYVYRGVALGRLTGRYLYGDFCTGTFWSLRRTPAGRAEDVRREAARLPQLTHIGADDAGEPLLASADGTIWRARPVPRVR